LRDLRKKYVVIFGEDNTEVEEAGTLDPFLRNYTWQNWFDILSGGDYLRWEQAEEIPLYRALNMMTFHIAKGEYEDRRDAKNK